MEPFTPVPSEVYLSKTLGQLKNKRMIVNLALRNLDKKHPNYQRALAYYSGERDKIQKAINQKMREAGIEPPARNVQMRTVDLAPKVGMRKEASAGQALLTLALKIAEELKQEGEVSNG